MGNLRLRGVGAVVVSLAVLAGCSSSSSDGGGSASNEEVNALFGTLPAPTPDKLRGVWGQTQQNGAATADLRFRFADGKITGGIKCTFGDKHGPVVVGNAQSLESADLDAGKGTFKPAAAVDFASTEPGVTCRGHMESATWSFAISGSTLTLTQAGKSGSVTLKKVGD